MARTRLADDWSDQLGRLYRLGRVGNWTDGQLLAQFLGREDPVASEAAFAELVDRHGPMVLRVCERILGNSHDAHDAFQATFLVLVRKARLIRSRESVGEWLFSIARRVANRARGEAMRRRHRLEDFLGERRGARNLEAAPMPEPEPDYSLLIAEIDRLPEWCRAPVVLHYFEGLSTEATAERLGCPRGTVLSRLARARNRLRSRIERRGKSLESVWPLGAAAHHSFGSAAVPASLAQATIRAAGALALGGAAIESVVPAAVAALSRGVLHTLALSRVRVAAGLILLTLAGVSIGLAATFRPTDEDGPTDSASDQANPQPVAAKRIKPTIDEKASDLPVVFHGHVVDPDGRPVAGAKLYLDYFRWSERDAAPPLRATSDADGRFRFAIAKSYFELPHLERWRTARVVALVEGYGPGGSDSDETDAGRELTVRLARDDMPIAGRLVDLEGRPVAGATIRVERISGPTSGDLTPWIKAANAREGTSYDLEYRYLKFDLSLNPNFPVPSRVTTGPDGRFTLRGIGRDRVAELRVEGETICTMEVAVLTRPGASVKAPILSRREDPWIKTYYPANRLELTATPSRPIEGTVRDRDTGAPIAGATIRSYQLADLDLMNNHLIRTQTDAQGRFRMTGMPLGKGNEVVIMPPTDQPYLPSWQRLPDLTVSQPLHVDLVLKRGVWAQGKVTDKLTGQPLSASIRYGAAPDNPHLGEAPGLRGVPTNGDGTTATDNQDDGTYRIAVLPGRGILAISVGEPNYPDPDPDERPDPIRYSPPIFGCGDASAEIDVAPNAKGFTHNFALEPGRMLKGTVLDPDGKPLAGAQVYGHGGMGWPQTSADFTVFGLTRPRPRTIGRLLQVRSMESLGSLVLPEKPRTLLFQHEGKRLAGFTDVSWETKEPVEVRLQPWSVVVGRIVDADGRPRAGFELYPQVLDKPRAGDTISPFWTYQIATDRDGRFRLNGIIPGLRHRLTFEDARGVRTGRGTIVTAMKPGEERDLGDIIADVPGESD
jgi:RNA polymerase sigma factor (sigma-70 family)